MPDSGNYQHITLNWKTEGPTIISEGAKNNLDETFFKYNELVTAKVI